MKDQILFCGGSHLAHAKEVIDDSAISKKHEINVDYIITAGARIRNQLVAGEEFTYNKETGISPPALKINSLKSFIPNSYSYIIIIGNYFIPYRLLGYFQNWDNRPMSTEITKEIILNSFTEIPHHSPPYSFQSTFIELLAKHKEGSTLIFVPDPRSTDTKVPPELICMYYECLKNYLGNLGINYVDHICETYSHETGAGLIEYLRNPPNDIIHMNQEYWKKQLAPVFEKLKT